MSVGILFPLLSSSSNDYDVQGEEMAGDAGIALLAARRQEEGTLASF